MADMNALSQRLVEIRNQRRLIAEEDKALKAEFDEVSEEVLQLLDEMGSESVKTGYASMSVKRENVPNITDWDQFYQFVKDQDALYLLQKRLSAAAWREQLELSGEVPGTEPFEKVTLNLRAR